MGEAWVPESRCRREPSTNQENTHRTVTIGVKIIFSCVELLYILHIYFKTAQHTLTNTEIDTLKSSVTI